MFYHLAGFVLPARPHELIPVATFAFSRPGNSPIVHLPIVCYLLIVLNGAITISTSEPRLLEASICQTQPIPLEDGDFRRAVGVFEVLPESACKTDAIQATVAYIAGRRRVWSVLPEALAVTLYALLAERKWMDRRALLVLCGCGTAIDDLYRLCIYISPYRFDIRLIWFRGLLTLIGGGERFYKMLTQVMIAENVDSEAITSIYYGLFAVSLLVSLVGNAFGAWAMRYSVEATFLSGVWIKIVAAVLPIYLPLHLAHHRSTVGNQYLPEDDGECLLPHGQTDQYSEDPKSLSILASETEKGSPHKHHKRQYLNFITQPLQSTKHFLSSSSLVPFVLTFLAISSLENFSQGVHESFQPWVSKRYHFTLSDTSFVLLLPKLTGLLNLLILIYLGRPAKMTRESKRRAKIATYGASCYVLGTISLALSDYSWMLVCSMVVLSGSAGFLESLKSHCTAALKPEQINLVYTALSVCEMLAEVLGGLFWSWVYETTYSAAAVGIGFPMWVDAFVCCVILVATILFFRMKLPKA